MSRGVKIAVVAGGAALIAAAVVFFAARSRPSACKGCPNILVIETDDQTVEDMAALPRVRELIGRDGVTFTNSFVNYSDCCPSRATFLTGQYAQNHHVFSNVPPDGGFYALDSAFRIADRVAMLYQGSLITVGTPAEFKASTHVRVRQFVQGEPERLSDASEGFAASFLKEFHA